MKPPPIRWADGPGGKIGYQVLGDGPLDLVFVQPGRSNLDVQWEHLPLERFFLRLASFSRLMLINFRGFGLADPVRGGDPHPIEDSMDDLNAVLDAVGSNTTAILGMETAGVVPILFAATFPGRVRALALVNACATLRRREDYPTGIPDKAMDRFALQVEATWGTGETLDWLAPEMATNDHFREWFARLERSSVAPSMVQEGWRQAANCDVRSVLGLVRTPTLVISHEGHPFIRPGHGRYLAEHLANARYVERPGFWGLYWIHDSDWVLDEVETFLTGTKAQPVLDDRVLSTVLFTDIVGSTERAVGLGDRRWHRLLDEHDDLMRREVERFEGHVVELSGDGLLVTFPRPAKAIRCAVALTEAIRTLGLEVRAGLHTGEIELRGDRVAGIAVHIAARVTAQAGAGEVLVSSAVPPLVAGSGLEFDDRGTRDLKGVPGEWRLYAVKA